jgi:excisionase family DNA binding protein
MNAFVLLTPEQLDALLQRAVREAMASVQTSGSDSPDVLTRAQAAELLQVTEHHVTRLHRKEGLPGHKLGREWRYRRSEILAWIAKRKGDR